MKYDIIPTQINPDLCRVIVRFTHDDGTPVLVDGQEYAELTVGKPTPEEAAAHVEEFVLPDLRRIYPRQLGDLHLPIDDIPQPDPPTEPQSDPLGV